MKQTVYQVKKNVVSRAHAAMEFLPNDDLFTCEDKRIKYDKMIEYFKHMGINLNAKTRLETLTKLFNSLSMPCDHFVAFRTERNEFYISTNHKQRFMQFFYETPITIKF
jgi:phenylalanyl-tRNA synthetase alpha subunit